MNSKDRINRNQINTDEGANFFDLFQKRLHCLQQLIIQMIKRPNPFPQLEEQFGHSENLIYIGSLLTRGEFRLQSGTSLTDYIGQRKSRTGPFTPNQQLIREDNESLCFIKTSRQRYPYVTLKNVMIKDILLQSSFVSELDLRYFVEGQCINLKDSPISQSYIDIRVEIFIHGDIFSNKFKQDQKNSQDQENAPSKQKPWGNFGGPQIINASRKTQYSRKIAERQMIVRLFRLVGVNVKEPALIVPEISKDLFLRKILVKQQVNDKKNFQFESACDMLCLSLSHSTLVCRFIKNYQELKYLRNCKSKNLNDFSKILCSRSVFEKLSSRQKEKVVFLRRQFINWEHISHLDMLKWILPYVWQQNADLDKFGDENPEVFESLKQQLKNQDKQLQKRITVKQRQTQNKIQFKQDTSGSLYKDFKDAIQKKRILLKLYDRNQNKILFQTFESDVRNIRQSPTPENIRSKLMPYQAQALTWMKYRQKLIPFKTVMKQGYQSEFFQSFERNLSPFCQQFELLSGTNIFTNYFTGCFSRDAMLSKNIKGGILAYDMGLGKTVTALSLIFSEPPNMKSSSSQPNSISTTLYVTISTVMSGQIQQLVEKHIKEPETCLIYVRKNRKQNIDFSKYRIVFTSYDTLKTEWKDFTRQRGGQFGSSDEELNSNLLQKTKTVYSYNWHRIILDEAHHIRNRTTQTCQAACGLRGDRRWCLTGTPIQNDKSELYALLKFLRVETFSDYRWWSRYIERSQTLEEGFGTIHKILRKIMLAKNKTSLDQDGKAIIQLPKKHQQEIYVDFTPEQNDIYQHIRKFTKSQITKQFGHKGRNGLGILALITKIRQFCDDPCLSFPNYSKVRGNKALLREQIQKVLTTAKKKSVAEQISELQTKNGQNGQITERDIQQIDPEGLGDFICKCCSKSVVFLLGFKKCPHQICEKCSKQLPLNNQGDKCCPICDCRLIELINNSQKPKQEMYDKKQSDQDQDEGKTQVEPYYSTKLLTILVLIEQSLVKGQKVIVFSQWLGMMERIHHQCRKMGWQSVTMNYTTKPGERRKILQQFMQSYTIDILVTSLKMCGEGLNLTVASSVILVDPQWNPTVQQQGIDRIHRFGQTKNVSVYRIIMRESIQQKLRQLHKKKADEKDYLMMDMKFFKGKKYIQKLLMLVS